MTDVFCEWCDEGNESQWDPVYARWYHELKDGPHRKTDVCTRKKEAPRTPDAPAQSELRTAVFGACTHGVPSATASVSTLLFCSNCHLWYGAPAPITLFRVGDSNKTTMTGLHLPKLRPSRTYKGELLPDVPTLQEAIDEHVERVLAACGGNRTKAAIVLGVNRRTVQHRLARIRERKAQEESK